MTILKKVMVPVLLAFSAFPCSSQNDFNKVDTIPYEVYPQVIDHRPNLPSPCITLDGKEYVVAVTKEGKYAIIQVSLDNGREAFWQTTADTDDFPVLARTGLHSEDILNHIKTITGRPIEEITELGRPNGLSQAGFMANDENILSVIKADNRIVKQLGLTHPQLAKPLFHVLNMMETDLSLNRWNSAQHRWENIPFFYYNGQKVFVEVEDTKGGQKSIFDDGIEGGFYIKLWRAFDDKELQFLKATYGHLSTEEFSECKSKLSHINTGEMQPQYIMRYGFYEGHTFWRADPIAISFIFGLRSLTELDRIFESRLYEMLTSHFTD